MSTVSELIVDGSAKVRLPFWNEHAYLEVTPESGPWAYLYDILCGIGGGSPRPMLIVECDKREDWQAKP